MNLSLLEPEGEPSPAQKIRLYPFQEQAVDALRANMRAGVKNQVLSAPTGSGKSVVSLYMIHEVHARGRRAVFVVDRVALINQTSALLDRYGIPHGIIQAQHIRTDRHQPVQLVSAQTLLNRPTWPDADVIFVDECHGKSKTVFERIAKRDCFTIGLTATPFAEGMAKHYDAVVSVTTTNKLIEEKYLAPFKVWAPSEPDMKGAKVVGGEWTDKEATTRAMPIVGDCVAEYLRRGDGDKFICFGATIAHCEEIHRQFLAAGVRTALYTNDTGADERDETLTEFRGPNSSIRGLLSVAALARGFDVEDIGVVILARPLRKSLSEHIQQLGRGLRRDPANPDKVLKVLDHSGNMVRHWAAMQEFFERGADTLDDGTKKPKKKPDAKEQKPAKCPKCSHVHAPRKTCPMCGFEYPRKRGLSHRPGELVEFGGDMARGNNDTAQSFYAQLIHIRNERGYKPGWPWVQFREKYGRPPIGNPAPEAPTYETLKWVQHQMIRYAKRRKA